MPEYTSFESINLQINGSNPTILATIYRPPKANSVLFVFKELSDSLTFLCSLSPNVILLGDFNMYIDNASNVLTWYFLFFQDMKYYILSICDTIVATMVALSTDH